VCAARHVRVSHMYPLPMHCRGTADSLPMNPLPVPCAGTRERLRPWSAREHSPRITRAQPTHRASTAHASREHCPRITRALPTHRASTAHASREHCPRITRALPTHRASTAHASRRRTRLLHPYPTPVPREPTASVHVCPRPSCPGGLARTALSCVCRGYGICARVAWVRARARVAWVRDLGRVHGQADAVTGLLALCRCASRDSALRKQQLSSSPNSSKGLSASKAAA
jgi:hypothetical protein